MTGKIIKNISNDYTIEANNQNYICKPSGKLRINNNTPLVGDIVEFDEINKYITKILPRKNKLTRPNVANIDIAIIVTSTKNPKLDTFLLDKILTITSYNNIIPIIYFSKTDLLNNQEKKIIKNYIKYYKHIGYITTTKPKKIIKLIKNKTVVLTGQSGAGKSTLLNKLNPSLNLKTDEISQALGRGKHTTRHTELFKIKTSYIVDTPGFSKISFEGMSNIDIRDNMNEMYDNLKHCEYQDCMHLSEKNCYVKKLVQEKKILESRYENYKNFLKGEK